MPKIRTLAILLVIFCVSCASRVEYVRDLPHVSSILSELSEYPVIREVEVTTEVAVTRITNLTDKQINLDSFVQVVTWMETVVSEHLIRVDGYLFEGQPVNFELFPKEYEFREIFIIPSSSPPVEWVAANGGTHGITTVQFSGRMVSVVRIPGLGEYYGSSSGTLEEETTRILYTELCQSISKTRATVIGSHEFAVQAANVGQEVLCNSMGRFVFSRAHLTLEEYVIFAQGSTLSPYSGGPEYPMVGFEVMWDSTPAVPDVIEPAEN